MSYALIIHCPAFSHNLGHLQTAGLIEYHRGRITVLDRPGLEARSCGCYAVVKKEFDRLLPEAIAPSV
jgi:hypothetical protein